MARTVRKTVNRVMLVTIANDAIAAAPTALERQAIATVISTVLLRGDSYLGFNYLASELNEDGSALREGYDDTMRRYF